MKGAACLSNSVCSLSLTTHKTKNYFSERLKHSPHPGWLLLCPPSRTGWSAGTTWCVHVCGPRWSASRPSSCASCLLNLSHGHSDQHIVKQSKSHLERRSCHWIQCLKSLCVKYFACFVTVVVTKTHISPGILLGFCSRLCLGSTWRHTAAGIKLPLAKTLFEVSKWMPTQTRLPGRRCQWWTGAHWENESQGPEDVLLVNHAEIKQIISFFFPVTRACNLPSFLLLWWPLPWVSVMSLNEKRKRTISPFSFFMGTMSNRHQKATPGTKSETLHLVHELERKSSLSMSWQISPCLRHG